MIVAHLLLLPNYRIFQKVDIQIENAERIPARGERDLCDEPHGPVQLLALPVQAFENAGIPVHDRLGEGQVLQERVPGEGARPLQPHPGAVDGVSDRGVLPEEVQPQDGQRVSTGRQGHDRRPSRRGGAAGARRRRGDPGDGRAICGIYPGLLRSGDGEGCGIEPDRPLRAGSST